MSNLKDIALPVRAAAVFIPLFRMPDVETLRMKLSRLGVDGREIEKVAKRSVRIPRLGRIS